ncbi:MAG: HAD family hydrolase [Ruminococcaceae bacterium]|nr:HAD family hydrolase [Oscillospiraceae bacterium]
MIKAILFDLDGTLADTVDDIGQGINLMRADLGLPPLSRQDTINNINNGAFMLVRRSLPELEPFDDEKNQEYLRIFQYHYGKCYNDKTYLYRGVSENVIALKKKGVKLGVLSNKPHPFVTAIIEKLFPESTFDAVIGQGQFPAKPDPASALHICKTLGCEPSECALVGDSNVDMITAKNAGLFSVGVTWGYRSPEILLENGAQLLVSDPAGFDEILNII